MSAPVKDTLSPLISDGTALTPDWRFTFADAGAGVATITPVIGTLTPTFSRASTAWTRLSTGLWASVAAGSPRAYYNEAGQYMGVLLECVAVTYRGLWSRDLTNAAWVKTGAPTVALTGTGIDGVANSCTAVTASAGATILQSYTAGSAQPWNFAPFIKRVSGTGTLEITCNGGATWVDVSSSLSSTVFRQVYCGATGLANPQWGFRFGTAGDQFLIDMANLTQGTTRMITPYATTSAAVTHVADSLTYPVPSAGGRTLLAVGSVRQNPAASAAPSHAMMVDVGDGTTSNHNIAYFSPTGTSIVASMYAGGISQFTSSKSLTIDVDKNYTIAATTFTNNVQSAMGIPADATVSVLDTTATMPTESRMMVGAYAASSGALTGCLRRIDIWSHPLPDNTLLGLARSNYD